MTDDQRISPLGQFLRSTSLDELPELWNVLRGEMSLVGPRPLLKEYLGTYSPDEHRRHNMPPGITGWAAVKGRHALEFEDRLKLDVWYVDHWSLWLDLKILALTVAHLLHRTDVATTQDLERVGFRLPGVGGRAMSSMHPDPQDTKIDPRLTAVPVRGLGPPADGTRSGPRRQRPLDVLRLFRACAPHRFRHVAAKSTGGRVRCRRAGAGSSPQSWCDSGWPWTRAGTASPSLFHHESRDLTSGGEQVAP